MLPIEENKKQQKWEEAMARSPGWLERNTWRRTNPLRVNNVS